MIRGDKTTLSQLFNRMKIQYKEHKFPGLADFMLYLPEKHTGKAFGLYDFIYKKLTVWWNCYIALWFHFLYASSSLDLFVFVRSGFRKWIERIFCLMNANSDPSSFLPH